MTVNKKVNLRACRMNLKYPHMGRFYFIRSNIYQTITQRWLFCFVQLDFNIHVSIVLENEIIILSLIFEDVKKHIWDVHAQLSVYVDLGFCFLLFYSKIKKEKDMTQSYHKVRFTIRKYYKETTHICHQILRLRNDCRLI